MRRAPRVLFILEIVVRHYFVGLLPKPIKESFLLRFDDTDVTRSTEEFAEAIHKDLAWLGLHHDTTAKQSDRLSKYEEAFQSLIDKDMVYACYEAPDELDRKRKRQLSRGLPPVYDRAALNLSSEDKEKFEQEGRAAHWRFKLSGKKVIWNDMIRGEQSVDTASLSDPVVRRHDGSFLYSLPSVVDDIEFGITHVIRGEDHVTNTATHIEMIEALGGKVPCLAHHPLLVMSDGSALSKRLGSLSVGSLRDQGLEAMSVNSLLARLGTPFPIEPRQTLEELVDVFDLSRLGRAPARFDEQELKRLNMKLLHDMPYALVAERLQAENIENAEDFWTTIRGNIELLSDIEVFGNVIAGEIGAVELSVDDKSYIQAAL